MRSVLIAVLCAILLEGCATTDIGKSSPTENQVVTMYPGAWR